jgi:hypothetical protein
MGIKVLDEPDVTVTASELVRYQDEYQRAYMFYSGTPPTLAEFIRRKQEAAKHPFKGQAFNG